MKNIIWAMFGFWLIATGFYYFGGIKGDFNAFQAKINLRNQQLDYQAYTPEEKK